MHFLPIPVSKRGGRGRPSADTCLVWLLGLALRLSLSSCQKPIDQSKHPMVTTNYGKLRGLKWLKHTDRKSVV